MGNFYGGEIYNSAFDITGPSGFYAINTPVGPVVSYVDQDYDGGGWVQIMSNTAYTGGMSSLSFFDAINTSATTTGISIPTDPAKYHQWGWMSRTISSFWFNMSFGNGMPPQ